MNYNTIGMGTYGSTWQAAAYSGNGNVQELIGTLADRVVAVCGNAHTVFDELELVRRKYDYEDLVVFGVNDVGMFLPRLDHWLTLHWKKLPAWKAARWSSGFTSDTKYHSIVTGEAIDYSWFGLNPLFALSGYFAAQVAYIMDARLIILCGCPGAPVRRFFEAAPRSDFGYGGGTTQSDDGVRQQFINEMNRVNDFKERLRSMGGWTRNYLGGL